MTEQEIIRENIGMAFVNGHISHQQAGEALIALSAHWRELAPRRKPEAGEAG